MQPLFFKVDIDEIREKVEKASSSSYNFKEKPTAATMDEAPGQEKQIEKKMFTVTMEHFQTHLGFQ